MKSKADLIKAILFLIENQATICLPKPFVADKSGDQEEITHVSNINGRLEVHTWNEDNGGDRMEEGYNQTYLSPELLTASDLNEVLTQLKDEAFNGEHDDTEPSLY